MKFIIYHYIFIFFRYSTNQLAKLMTRSCPQLACLLSWLLSAAPVYTSRGQGSSLGKTEFFWQLHKLRL